MNRAQRDDQFSNWKYVYTRMSACTRAWERRKTQLLYYTMRKQIGRWVGTLLAVLLMYMWKKIVHSLHYTRNRLAFRRLRAVCARNVVPGRRVRSASVGREIPWRPSRITRVSVTHVGTIRAEIRITITTTA